MFGNHNSVSDLNTDRIISVREQNNTLLILRRLCGGYYQQCPGIIGPVAVLVRCAVQSGIIGLVDADAPDGDTVNCFGDVFS